MLRAAIHEAGHAVTAIAYGAAIDHIFIGIKAPSRVVRISSTNLADPFIKVSGYIAERIWQRRKPAISPEFLKAIDPEEFFSHPRYGSDSAEGRCLMTAFPRAEKLLRINEKALFALAKFLENNPNRHILQSEILPVIGVWEEKDEYVTKSFRFCNNWRMLSQP
jgi:hypothetical protein